MVEDQLPTGSNDDYWEVGVGVQAGWPRSHGLRLKTFERGVKDVMRGLEIHHTGAQRHRLK